MQPAVTISCAKMDATLCILAGGESRRMGQPKAELRVRDQPILSYLLGRFRWSGPTMLVTAPSRRSPPGAELCDREVIDPIDGAGPLRGLLSALENLATPLVIITTLDMPGIDGTHLHWLRKEIDSQESTCLGLMCRRDDHIEPFPSIYRAGAIDVVRERFLAGERSVAEVSKLPRFRAV